MAEQSSEITLEDVRNRFLEAETRLTEAATAVAAIQDAAGRLGAAREGLGAASERLGGLAGSMEEVAASLTDNATHLREGVDAIRAGDPAEIRRQIEELDAAFTAMQVVVGERLTKLEQQGVVTARDLSDHATAAKTIAAQARRESLLLGAILIALVVAAIVIGLVR